MFSLSNIESLLSFSTAGSTLYGEVSVSASIGIHPQH